MKDTPAASGQFEFDASASGALVCLFGHELATTRDRHAQPREGASPGVNNQSIERLLLTPIVMKGMLDYELLAC